MIADGILPALDDVEPGPTPWDAIRWTKLKKIGGQAFSEVGKRSYGKPTCIAVAAFIALGTSKGLVLLFDYSQELKVVFGLASKGVSFDSTHSFNG
ncbi:MAG: Vacuolar protein sorting-associated protein 8 [Phylliscum demangeonii]|nr:MAG: Vacuolar protein sorting-associated protein 8 [Phylliscum demangeonii]